MRSHIKVLAVVAASLLVSTVAAVAQTGEFVATVPGEVVHAGYALQDAWQNAKNAAPASQPVDTLQRSKPRHNAMRWRHIK
jgi:hypothetical protein